MTEYQEKEKKIARQACLKKAILSLTQNRHHSTLTRRSYVSDVKNYLMKEGTIEDKEIASELTEESIKRWENFYDSIVQTRSAKDLKVAYLAGPNPENDLEELVNLGILPENVWAFESDNKTYGDAVLSTLQSRFPFIKIFNGNISSFLKLSPLKFDIIYLDFCSPIASSEEKNLKVIINILSRHALNSPGALITNFSFPSKENDLPNWEPRTKLISYYLYPKMFLESNDEDNNLTEGVVHELDIDEFIHLIQQDADNYYGQFITRVLIDAASVTVPYESFFMQDGIFNKFFTISNHQEFEEDISKLYHFDDEGNGGDIITETANYPLLFTIDYLDSKRRVADFEYDLYLVAITKLLNDHYFRLLDFYFHTLIQQRQQRQKFKEIANSFLKQFLFAEDKSRFKKLEQMLFLLSGKQKYYSSKILKLAERKWSKEIYLFCDYLLFHQILELLIRQLAVPYHVNVETTTRWTYKGKKTQMFLDMIILDECRYVYDWMPTIDMLENSIDNLERQLAYRFALDAVGKHRRWYNVEYFSGTAIVDQFKDTFQAKILKPRIKIN